MGTHTASEDAGRRVPSRWMVAAAAVLVMMATGCGDDGGGSGAGVETGREPEPLPDEIVELIDFIRIGHLEYTDVVEEAAGGVALGSEGAAELATYLEENWPQQPGVPPPEQGEIGPALRTPMQGTTIGFGFLASGCAATGAVMESDVGPAELGAPLTMRAVLTGGEGVACEAPEYYLATFHISIDDVEFPVPTV